MDFFNFFGFAVLLFCGTFAQRFQRHALKNGTHDELINGTTVNDTIDVEELVFADGSLVKQIGDDLNLVGDGDINIQLDNDKDLIFERCSTFSSNCLGEIITVRYDAQNPVSSTRERRGSGQCEFKSTIVYGGKEKAEVKKETAPKPGGKEKKEAAVGPVEKEGKAKKHPKQSQDKKAAVQEKQPIVKEDSKPPTQDAEKENTKVSKEPVEDPAKKVTTEPTHEDPKPDATFKPFALVPTDAVHPIPKAYRVQNRSSSLSSLKSGRKDSLSERNDIYMAMVVELATRIIGAGKMDLATKLDLKAKMDVFGLQTHVLEPREIGLFCCSLDIMFIKVEMLIDEAAGQMEKLGCTMDKLGYVVSLSRQAKRYFANPAAPAFVRCYAFGGVFRDLIDEKVGEKPIMSIQLLFVIALQRRYSLANRQHALTFIRKELPIMKEYYFATELRGLPFPVNAIEEAFNLDPAGFNLALEDAT